MCCSVCEYLQKSPCNQKPIKNTCTCIMYNPNTLKLIGSFGTCIIYSSAHNFYSTVTKINILKLNFYITNPILNIIQCYKLLFCHATLHNFINQLKVECLKLIPICLDTKSGMTLSHLQQLTNLSIFVYLY